MLNLQKSWQLFRVFSFALLATMSLSTSAALDLNQNGISDVYESFYPPLPGQSLPSNSDSDGDGFNDLDEIAFGTDWRLNSSHPSTTISPEGSDFSFSWHGVGGIRYQVLNTDLLSSSTIWLPVGGVLIGSNQAISVQVSTDGLDKAFWRLSTKNPLDSDNDFLNTYEEALLGTSDSAVDSDNDGNSDTQEFQQGTDPTDDQDSLLPTIEKIFGNNQGGAASTISGMPLVVQIAGAQAEPLFHVPITYAITSGAGALIPDRSNPNPVQSVTIYSDEQGGAGSFFQFPSTVPTETQITATVRSGTQTNSVTFTTTTSPAPSNDLFAQALSLDSETSPFSQTNAGSTLETSEPVHADTLQGSSVWFSWTAPSTGRVEFRTDGSSFDTVLAVYTGSTIGQLIEIASSDDQTDIDPLPFASKVTFQANQGSTYRIAVSGFAAATGNIVLAWGGSSGPDNDFFSNAELLTGDTGTVTASNIGATQETNEPNHNGEIHSGSLWYRFVAPEFGTLTVNTATTAFESVIAIYSGSTIENLVEVAAVTNIDAGPAELRFPVTANTTYWIAVAGIGTLTGNLSTFWSFQESNDNFADAHQIAGASGTINGSNVDATAEPGEPWHWYDPMASVWYSWVAPSSGYYVFDTIGSDFDSALAVYTGSELDELIYIAVDGDSGGNGAASVWFNAIEGETYKIAVDVDYNSPTGSVVLNWNPYTEAQQSEPSHSHSGENCQTCLIQQLQHEAEMSAQRDGENQASNGGISPLNEPECEDPAAANYGEVISYDENGNETTSQTFYLSLPKASNPSAPPPPPCPQTLVIQHKIVTVNTPRARNLPGKLSLKVKSGDASKLEIKHNGSTYTPGTPIDVVEYGHSGCGVHDWHFGYETFELTGKSKGEVVFEVECDPDPDDGGDGAATKKLDLTVKIFDLTYTTDPLAAIGVSATTSWEGDSGYSVDPESIKQKITVVTDPPEVASLITLEVKELDQELNPEYIPTGLGTITATEESDFEYSAFEEPKSAKAPKEKSVVIVAKIADEELCAKHKVKVLPVFRWLTSTIHQHGPGADRHPPEISDYETAWRYARWKYGISTSNLSSIVYQENNTTGGHAMTSFSTGSKGSRPCEIYQSAFVSENYCASVLGHENVHGGQSVNWFLLRAWTIDRRAFNRKIEYPAYKWQVDNAGKCGLADSEREQFESNMNRTKEGLEAE